jgi:hypothetical protein
MAAAPVGGATRMSALRLRVPWVVVVIVGSALLQGKAIVAALTLRLPFVVSGLRWPNQIDVMTPRATDSSYRVMIVGLRRPHRRQSAVVPRELPDILVAR